MRGTRIAALLTGAAAALMMTACGVPPSSVVEAGEPATGMPAGVEVYFLAGGRLVAVPRRAPGTPDLATAVRLLFAGPTGAESSRLTTALPLLPRPPLVKDGGDTVVVRLPARTDPLGTRGQQQLMCTVVHAPDPYWDRRGALAPPAGGRKPVPPVTSPPGGAARALIVRVIGTDWEVDLGSGSCPFLSN
ncbi:hypothetical protein GCM10018793_54450 [Streptomyces sulfonofaciens]|uniref:Lipoprotein n=1 Tax=Streptomyces sulfonofaciens TaxID=68272 RepID=A0A919GJ88_9ACTN|nr:hypothetical protein [Streptomyces sulfonofaciens]GHH85642.1 hypothetical protein GCM10018793_54450 [Streptomyces sulfonofaciens]